MTNRKFLSILPVIVATGVLLALAAFTFRSGSDETDSASTDPDIDRPPVIEFTWTPAGAVDLQEMRGLLRITDDRGIDFSSYRMNLLEVDKSLDIPIGKSMMGREYEQTVSFSLIADHPRLAGKDKLTVRIIVADTAGQFTTIEREVKLKPFGAQLEARMIAPPAMVDEPTE